MLHLTVLPYAFKIKIYPGTICGIEKKLWIIQNFHSPHFSFVRPACLDVFGWMSHRAASLTIEKNSNSIRTKQLWLSSNTKDVPFFSTVAFRCFLKCNGIKVKITAKDDYKPFEKLGQIVVSHPHPSLSDSTNWLVRCDFRFNRITSMAMNTRD